MPVQGRPKGSKAEIEIAKRLKAWWAREEVAEFVRTPLSGGWGGKDLRAGFQASGDVMTTSRIFPFTIEVKRREGWSWLPLLAGKKSPVFGYWKQAVGQAEEQGGIPLLFFRKNREPWWMMLPYVAARDSGMFETAAGDGMSWIVGHAKMGALWAPSELKASGVDVAGVFPIAVKAELFWDSNPAKWRLVAPTFPRG